jgi:hypothetical protein
MTERAAAPLHEVQARVQHVQQAVQHDDAHLGRSFVGAPIGDRLVLLSPLHWISLRR